MKLTMLGTGMAVVKNCYNTCFVLSEDESHFLIDGGGGNQILSLLEEKKIPLSKIHDIFVSHGHTDHIMGIIWVIRVIGHMIAAGKYENDLNIYCHKELCEGIKQICHITLGEKISFLFGKRIHLVTVENGDKRTILDNEVTFFDLHSHKMKQFGFLFQKADGTKLAFCGDEPLSKQNIHLVKYSDWFMHEAFCLYAERDIFKPYEKSHSTVKEACELAENLGIKHLILYHTEDTHINARKSLYYSEGKQYYNGTLLIPDDGEEIMI